MLAPRITLKGMSEASFSVLSFKVFGIKAPVWEISSLFCTLEGNFMKKFQGVAGFSGIIWQLQIHRSLFCCFSEKLGLCAHTPRSPCAALLPASASRGRRRGEPEEAGRGFIPTASLFLSWMQWHLDPAAAAAFGPRRLQHF